MHWVRALLAGVAAEVLTIVTIIIATKAFQVNMETAGLVLGAGGGVVFTSLMALWALRAVPDRYVAHGLLVAVWAVVLHLLGAAGAPGGFRAIYLVADALKLAAGALGGVLTARRR